MQEPQHTNVHDPADLAPGEPPDENFDGPESIITASVIDGTGREVQPSTFDLLTSEGEPESREAAVFQAIGAATVCWEDMSGTGIFQDEKARAIADGLLAWLDENDRSRFPHGELETFRKIHDTSQRLRDKLEAEPSEDLWSHDAALNHPGPLPRWRQLEDGTWASDRYTTGPGVTVMVERQSPADLPFIHVVGRMQEINPGAARWLSLRLAEASAIVETANIP